MSQSVFDMPGFVPEPQADRPQTVFDMTAPEVAPDAEPAEVPVVNVPEVAPKPRPAQKPAGQSAEAVEEGK